MTLLHQLACACRRQRHPVLVGLDLLGDTDPHSARDNTSIAAFFAALALVPLPGVVTPTGNIRCFYVPAKPAHLLCDIRSAEYARHEQDACQARAGLDWHGWEVYATRRTITVCSGGILYNANRNRPVYTTLAYGRTWRFGAFTCVSRASGLTCATGTGHGIFLSRQSWRGW
jgi:hypothetical protein